MNLIYETTGRAREFSELALNLYSGCGHGCLYCYSPLATHTDRKRFENEPRPRVDIAALARNALQLQERGETRKILISFTSDPYQPLEGYINLTHRAIDVLHTFGLHVIILTKGGLNSMKDFDLLTPNDEYATTLTCMHQSDSLYWEPQAGLPHHRIRALKIAHGMGIPTWVSLEPVIYPQDSIYLAQLTKDFATHYKVGKLNYHPHAQTIDWIKFLNDIEAELQRLNKPYYIKKDLAKYKGLNEGYWWRPK